MKNRIKNKIPISFKYLLMVYLMSLILYSCQNYDLEIQQDFPFEIQVMPVPKNIANGETVEIRSHIITTGNYSGTEYAIRYFQYEGKGSLKLLGGFPFKPNDIYPLHEKEFRLYYTSESVISQSFDIWISDNMGHEQKVSFQFTPQNVGTL